MGRQYVERTGRAIRLLKTTGELTSRPRPLSSAQCDGHPLHQTVAEPLARRQPRVPCDRSRAISEFAQRRSVMLHGASMVAGAEGEKEQYADI
jgi:hypothetical protein